jgi:hypothetical protein
MMFQRMCSVVGGVAGMVVGLGLVVLLRLTLDQGFLK